MTGIQVKEMVGGLFMILVFAILVFLVVFVGQKQGFLEKKVTYHILFPNVSGLQDGAQVTLGGVSVGYVDKVSLTYRDNRPFVMVDAVVFERHITQIRTISITDFISQFIFSAKTIIRRISESSVIIINKCAIIGT